VPLLLGLAAGVTFLVCARVWASACMCACVWAHVFVNVQFVLSCVCGYRFCYCGHLEAGACASLCGLVCVCVPVCARACVYGVFPVLCILGVCCSVCCVFLFGCCVLC